MSEKRQRRDRHGRVIEKKYGQSERPEPRRNARGYQLNKLGDPRRYGRKDAT